MFSSIACASAPAEYVEYKSSPSLQVCGGTRSYLENFVPFFADELGLTVEPDIFRYSWLDEEQYLTSGCPTNSAGCQVNEQVYSRKPALIHEMVHAVTYVNEMNNLSFFTEGIAVAYDQFNGSAPGPRYRFYPPTGETTPDPRDYMVGMLDAWGYDVAGSFVTFLLLRHGPAKFVSVTRALDFASSLQEIRTVFLQEYGVNLDEEVELYMRNDPCSDSGFSVRAYDCAMPQLPREGPVWSWSTSISCDDDAAVGGIEQGRASNRVKSVALDIPSTGLYAIKLEGDVAAQVTIGRCFGCPWAPKDTVVQAGEALAAELSVGPHFIRLTSPSEVESTLRFTLKPVE